MPSAYRKKGKTIHSEAREVIRRVIEACDIENVDGRLQFSINEPTRRAAFYTGFSERTICRIRREYYKIDEKKLSPPEDAEANHTTTDSTESGICDIQLVRNVLMDLYLVSKVVPTRSRLLAAIVRKKKDVQWGVNKFRRLLRDIGFKWKKFKRTKKILLERPQISLWRFEYLKSIKKAREENKNIIYVGDTWVDNKLNIKNCWHSNEWLVLQTSRFIILEAGNENGFVSNVRHITKVGQTTDYRDLLNYENFKKWLTEKLLPNIPQDSVIVLDGSVSYHLVEQNKAPSKYATRWEMLDWLETNSVPFSPQMCKVELADLIDKFKSDKKVYCIDELLKLKGHTVLRLPPYMCELSPLHAAWAKLDTILREKKKSEASSLTLTSFNKLKAIIMDSLDAITDADWKGFCSEVQKREHDYREMDGTLDAEMDEIIADAENCETVGSTTDSGSEFSDTFSDHKWPPFELVECGEDPTMGYEQPELSRQDTVSEGILEKHETKHTKKGPKDKSKKRKRKEQKQTKTRNGDVTDQNGNEETLSSVDVFRLKKEMQKALNKKSCPEVSCGDGAVASTSRHSEQFAEVLIKEEITLIDTTMVNVYGEEEELPVAEIKHENFPVAEECNPLDAANTEEN